MRITFTAFRNRYCPTSRKCRGRIRFPRASFPYVGVDQRFRDGNRKNITKLYTNVIDPVLYCNADPQALLEQGAHGTSDGIDDTHASLCRHFPVLREIRIRFLSTDFRQQRISMTSKISF